MADLQRLLIAEGINVRGGVDGVFSIWTVYAVQTFQRMHRIHANGIVDETTARALGMLSGPWNAFGVGATGTSVSRVQQALINRGIAVRGGVTGRFDVWTCYAVQTFQRRQGLRISGVVDGETARALGLLTAPRYLRRMASAVTGVTGINVSRAQRALMDLGVAVRGGAPGRSTCGRCTPSTRSSATTASPCPASSTSRPPRRSVCSICRIRSRRGPIWPSAAPAPTSRRQNGR